MSRWQPETMGSTCTNAPTLTQRPTSPKPAASSAICACRRTPLRTCARSPASGSMPIPRTARQVSDTRGSRCLMSFQLKRRLSGIIAYRLQRSNMELPPERKRLDNSFPYYVNGLADPYNYFSTWDNPRAIVPGSVKVGNQNLNILSLPLTLSAQLYFHPHVSFFRDDVVYVPTARRRQVDSGRRLHLGAQLHRDGEGNAARQHELGDFRARAEPWRKPTAGFRFNIAVPRMGRCVLELVGCK